MALEEVVLATGAVSDCIAPEGDLHNVEWRQVLGCRPSAIPVITVGDTP